MLLYNASNTSLNRFEDVIIIKTYNKCDKASDIVLDLSTLYRSSRLKVDKY